jgi:tryptophan synthase alpha chain
MNRINEKIINIKKNKKIGFMGHIIAGFPDLKTSLDAALGICEGGADFLEVQFPFSDPAADGPIIESASYQALENGFTIQQGFQLVENLAKKTDTVIFIMTYANIVFKYGIEKFIKKTKETGAKGVIIPDIPLEYDEGLNKACKENEIANIFVAAPGANSERIKRLSNIGEGILYVVVRRGITGKKTELDQTVFNWLNLVKQNSILPIAAGFGIQSKEQIKELEGIADIAVVGSYFTKSIKEAFDKQENVNKKLFDVTKSLID